MAATKPKDSLTTQVLALLTAAKAGEGQVATVVMATGTYVGPTTVHWFDNAGVPTILMVSVVSDGRTVLIPWHAVRAIEPKVVP